MRNLFVRSFAFAVAAGTALGSTGCSGAAPDEASATSLQDLATESTSATTLSCRAGFNSAWTGNIAGTSLTAMLCVGCGEVYVTAKNAAKTAEGVEVENGAVAAQASVPAGGIASTGTVVPDGANAGVRVCTSKETACTGVIADERYCNPVRGLASIGPERIDQGVDYSGAGPLYAVGPGVIEVAEYTSGWPGGGGADGAFLSYRLTAGPATGTVMYIAENIALNGALKPGSFVYNGTVLGTLRDASPDLETGFAIPDEDVALAQDYGGFNGSTSTALGINYNQLLVALGAPSGVQYGEMGYLPSGWQTNWPAAIAKWQ